VAAGLAQAMAYDAQARFAEANELAAVAAEVADAWAVAAARGAAADDTAPAPAPTPAPALALAPAPAPAPASIGKVDYITCPSKGTDSW
jgi:hypothetical protein